MNYKMNNFFSIVSLAAVLSACDGSSDSTSEVSQLENSCAPESGISYVCGLVNAEDLLSVGDTGMILTSGMNGSLNGANINGHLYMVNTLDDSWEDLVGSPNFSQDFNDSVYTSCPGQLNTDNFSAHGLALKPIESAYFDLYVTSHGAREAVEIFNLDLRDGISKLTWRGCVPLDETIMHNSLAILNDGGFVTTQFMVWAEGVESAFAGEAKGSVVIWHPGSQPETMPGSELAAPNGIVLSEDERFMYVAAFGSRELFRFDITQEPLTTDSVRLDIMLDNVRWGEPGKLLTAGGNVNGDGWSVVEIDAGTLEAKRVGGMNSTANIQGVSSALQVSSEIWVGTYSGDRIAYFTKE